GLADRLWRDVHGLRLMGSAALGLAYVACGRMEVYCHRSIYPWDITAGILLVRNARGSVTDWEGNQATAMTKQIVAGPGGINTLFRKWCAAQA
ncbi:MAG: inositol monophosphatase, partial [Chloroflexi bacterium]|nr:inositol monophosphatase [Chloroflexota bacterium]